MKIHFIITISIFVSLCCICSCKKNEVFELVETRAIDFEDSSFFNPKNSLYLEVLEKYINKGFPGAAMLVKTSDDGLWLGTKGMACIENKTEMQIGHLFYGGSMGKTYCAATVMLLNENDLIELDGKMADYLPLGYCDKIPNGNELTIKQLLNMQSGIPDISDNPNRFMEEINIPFAQDKYSQLEFIFNEPPDFVPGSKTYYQSTSYELLAMIIEEITGKNHGQVYEEMIFTPLGLKNTYCIDGKGYKKPDGLVNAYLNRFGDGKIENYSEINFHMTSVLTGSDGIVASIYDFYLFYEAIFNGDLLSEESKQTMKSWGYFDDSDRDPKRWTGYGLGLELLETPYGICYGHGGSMGGAGSYFYYFPEHDTYMGLMVNVSTSIRCNYSDMFKNEFWDDALKAIFENSL